MIHVDMHYMMRRDIVSVLLADSSNTVRNGLRKALHRLFMKARLNIPTVGFHAVPQWRGNPNRIDWPWSRA